MATDPFSERLLKLGGLPATLSAAAQGPVERLKKQIGDFVEPKTRFDRSHLNFRNGDTVEVITEATHKFSVSFAIKEGGGPGALGSNTTRHANAGALSAHMTALLQRARSEVQARLQTWGDANALKPTARLSPPDCHDVGGVHGFVYQCGTCSGQGHVQCPQCNGARRVTCSSCSGHGRRTCSSCNGTTKLTCMSCGGSGHRSDMRTEYRWDSATNEHRPVSVQTQVPCGACSGGKINCLGCSGGQVTCNGCGGGGQVDCSKCGASGKITCTPCAGTGSRNETAWIDCGVAQNFDVSAQSRVGEITTTLNTLKTPEDLVPLGARLECAVAVNGAVLIRKTTAYVPVTSVDLNIAGNDTTIRAFGPAQHVFKFKNIIDLLLRSDLDALNIVLDTGKFVPSAGADLMEALGGVLASEANVHIAAAAAEKAPASVLAKGAVSEAFAASAGRAIKRATARAYWAHILRGPSAALLLPLLALPAVMIFAPRGNGIWYVLFALAALTFAAGVAGHFWTQFQLRQQIGDTGPTLTHLVNKFGLPRIWLIAAGVAALVLPVPALLTEASLLPKLMPASAPTYTYTTVAPVTPTYKPERATRPRARTAATTHAQTQHAATISATAPTSPQPPPQARALPPGRWTGVLRQGSQTYPMEAQIGGGAAKLAFPSLGCFGHWQPVGTPSGASWRVREVRDVNPGSACASVVFVDVAQAADRVLMLRYHYTATGPVVATAMLTTN